MSILPSATYAGGISNFLRLLAGGGSTFSEQAIAFQEASTDVGAKIAVKNTGNGAYDIILANRDTSSITSTMTERMRITNEGVVGIGTATPTQAKVVISGVAGGYPLTNYQSTHRRWRYAGNLWWCYLHEQFTLRDQFHIALLPSLPSRTSGSRGSKGSPTALKTSPCSLVSS